MLNGRSIDELADIARLGGGFTISARAVEIEDLARIARLAGGKGRINIVDADVLSHEQIKRLARLGSGSAFFSDGEG